MTAALLLQLAGLTLLVVAAAWLAGGWGLGGAGIVLVVLGIWKAVADGRAVDAQ